jgi:hypothetical protein
MAKSNSQTRLAALADQLRDCLKADAKNIYTYGAILTEANRILEHGQWGPWLEDFGISEASARNYMAAHKFKLAVQSWPMFKSAKFADLKLRPSAIYMLAGLLDEISTLGRKDGTTDFACAGDDSHFFAIGIPDIEAVLVAAKNAWVGPKRLEAILYERHPEAYKEDNPEPVTTTIDTAPADETEETDEDPEVTPRQPRAPKSETVAPRVTAQLSFSSYVLGLWDLCEEAPSTLKSPQLKLEQIERVIALLTEVAKLLTPTVVPLRPAGSVEIPIDDVKAAHAATEVEVRP